MSSIFILFVFLILALLLALAKRIKSCVVIILIMLIYVMAIGSGLLPYLLLKPLQSPFINPPAIQWKKNNAIILLGGGTVKLPDSNTYIPSTMSYSRIYKTATLYFSCIQQHAACRIIISGGPIKHTEKSDALVYERALVQLGTSQKDFILELNSTDTQGNAQFTKEILEKSSFDQAVIVTSGIHMKRSLLWFSHFGIQTLPAPSDYSKPHFNMMSLGYNFALTDFALHEYLGIVEVYFYDFFN